MNEHIKLPEDEQVPLNVDDDFSGCIVIKAADGSPLLLEAKDFQPFVLTCGPTEGKLLQTQSLGVVEDIDLGGSELVLGFGYPDPLDSLGEDH